MWGWRHGTPTLLLRVSLSLSAFSTRSSLRTRPSISASSSSGCPANSPRAATCGTVSAAAFDTIALRSIPRSFFSHWPSYPSRSLHIHSHFLLRILRQRKEWGAALELELKEAGIFLTPHIVDQVVTCIPRAKLALQFFVWAGEQIGYPPPTSEAAYSITQWYAHKSQAVSFLHILRSLQNRHFYLSPSRVNVLLQGYGWAGMLDRAYDVMSREQGFSNDLLVNCFLVSIMRQFRYDMVYDVYLEMTKWGTALDLCYNPLIHGMSLAGGDRWQEADHLYSKMVDIGQSPNEATCNALAVSISKAGKHERVYELLRDMVQKKIKLENATVSVMIECFCHAKQPQRASRLIEEARQCGCLMDSNAFNSFLEAL